MYVNTLTSRAHARIAVVAGAAAIALAACGSDPAPIATPADPAPAEAAADATPETTPAPAAPTDAAVKISQTELGDVLADPDGMTLYAFTNDVDAVSTCSGTCAEAWPPVIVPDDFIVSPGLDSGIFATTERDDGQLQLVAGKFPLYLYAADAKPGDITGQGSGDVWFAVDTTGRLVGADGDAATPDESGDAAEPEQGDSAPTDPYATSGAALIATAESDLGTIVTDADGLTLYLFTDDADGEPTCVGGCARAWPPYLITEDPAAVAPEGIDASLLSTVEHPDGGTQLKLGKWPLYYFASDVEPGDVTGQGSGDVWFAVAADGTAIR